MTSMGTDVRADDLFDEAAWLTLHATLLQMPTADFAKHAARLLGFLSELDRLRRVAPEIELLPREALGGTPDEVAPAHPDSTGQTREPPHCPSCSCRAES